MLSISEKTVPFVTASLPELLNQVADSLRKGFFHYSAVMSPDGSAAFDQDIVQEIERRQWAAKDVGSRPVVKYFRTEKWGILLSKEGSFFRPEDEPGDFRTSPVDFREYRVTCKEAEGGHEISFSINPTFMAMHSMTLTRPIHSVETVGRILRKLLEVNSPEIVDQVETILLAANVKRKAAGVELVSRTAAGLPEAEVLSITPLPDRADQRLF